MEGYQQQLEQLINGEIAQITITKQQFIAFREVLVNHPKFKHFKGEALQGATIIYTYSDVPRS